MSSYPRESVEYVTFAAVTVDGAPVTVYDYAVTSGTDRPPAVDAVTGWTAVDTVDGKQGFLLDGTRARDTYHVWVKVDDTPEHPVIDAGTFSIL